MINKTELYKKFGEAIRWNSLLFFLNKISKTIIPFFLFYRLTQNDFSVWANIYSLIFILTLWTDFGFSRSLPQFCLAFAKNTQSKNAFIKKVIIFKIIITLTANLFFLLFAPILTSILKLTAHKIYFNLGGLLFFTESIKSVLRLIFYSYFWQKTFNFIESIIIMIQTAIIFGLIALLQTSPTILLSVFIVEIVAYTVMILLAFHLLKRVKADKNYQGQNRLNERQLMKNFIKHSAVMWSIISINSLTERNFLLPFFTFTLGHGLANIFKVANDLALFFQRFVIKSIGTTGTSLLAHFEVKQVQLPAKSISNVVSSTNKIISQRHPIQNTGETIPILLREAFFNLNKRVLSLVLPLFGILLFVFLQIQGSKGSYFATKLGLLGEREYFLLRAFLVLTILYLIQIIFMAYERILEVKRNYKELFISFVPYFGIVLFLTSGLFFKDYMVYLSLIPILLILHFLRIVSLLIKIIYAKSMYSVKFPLRFAIIIATLSIVTALIINNLFNFFCFTY